MPILSFKILTRERFSLYLAGRVWRPGTSTYLVIAQHHFELSLGSRPSIFRAKTLQSFSSRPVAFGKVVFVFALNWYVERSIDLGRFAFYCAPNVIGYGKRGCAWRALKKKLVPQSLDQVVRTRNRPAALKFDFNRIQPDRVGVGTENAMAFEGPQFIWGGIGRGRLLRVRTYGLR